MKRCLLVCCVLWATMLTAQRDTCMFNGNWRLGVDFYFSTFYEDGNLKTPRNGPCNEFDEWSNTYRTFKDGLMLEERIEHGGDTTSWFWRVAEGDTFARFSMREDLWDASKTYFRDSSGQKWVVLRQFGLSKEELPEIQVGLYRFPKRTDYPMKVAKNMSFDTEGFSADEVPVDTHRVYSLEGVLTRIEIYKFTTDREEASKMFTPVVGYYPSGAVRFLTQIRNYDYDSLYIEFHENGQLLETGHYTNGAKLGAWKGFYADGKKRYVRSADLIADEVRETAYTAWWPNGNLQAQLDTAAGVYKSWYESGAQEMEITVENYDYSLLHPHTIWGENGDIIETRTKETISTGSIERITRYYEAKKPEYEGIIRTDNDLTTTVRTDFSIPGKKTKRHEIVETLDHATETIEYFDDKERPMKRIYIAGVGVDTVQIEEKSDTVRLKCTLVDGFYDGYYFRETPTERVEANYVNGIRHGKYTREDKVNQKTYTKNYEHGRCLNCGPNQPYGCIGLSPDSCARLRSDMLNAANLYCYNNIAAMHKLVIDTNEIKEIGHEFMEALRGAARYMPWVAELPNPYPDLPNDLKSGCILLVDNGKDNIDSVQVAKINRLIASLGGTFDEPLPNKITRERDFSQDVTFLGVVFEDSIIHLLKTISPRLSLYAFGSNPNWLVHRDIQNPHCTRYFFKLDSKDHIVEEDGTQPTAEADSPDRQFFQFYFTRYSDGSIEIPISATWIPIEL